MDITIAEVYLGIVSVVMICLWQRERMKYQNFRMETIHTYIAIHEDRATMQVEPNKKGGKTISINHH